MVRRFSKWKNFDWRGFFGISEDGWSSSRLCMDLLLKHLRRKSKSVDSRKSYCYIVWLLCSLEVDEKTRLLQERERLLTPDELVSAARENPTAVAKLIQDIADFYDNAGSTRYANSIIHISRTFFKVNKIDLELHGYFQPTRSRKRPEHIPTLKEALKMADVAGSLRDRLLILLLTYTGLRNSTARALIYNETYPDRLLQEYTIKKELERREECLILIIHEAMKLHVSSSCKNRVFYYVFLPPEATECLRLHLSEMESKYGPMLDDHVIFPTNNRKISLRERRRTPISKRQLEEIVKNLARRAGIKNWRDIYPHSLRKTFESFLRNQPDELKLDWKERTFFFGHTLPGSEDTYFDKTKIEEMRAKYAKMVFEPVAGTKKEEQMVSEDELPTFLQSGWFYEATLPSGKVVVWRKVAVKESGEAKNGNVEDLNVSSPKSKTPDLKLRPPELLDSINEPLTSSNNPETVNAPSTKTGQSSIPKPIDPSKQGQKYFPTIASSKDEPLTEEKDSPKVNPKKPATKLGQKSMLDFAG